MIDAIKENNKLRNQQMGNMPASEMTSAYHGFIN